MLARTIRLRCPVCGRGPIFQTPFRVRHSCAECGAIFQREEGFFVGAIMTNVVATEATILSAYLLTLLAAGDVSTLTIGVLFAIGLLFPILFYHHSWSLWLGLDHYVEGLPGGGQK